MLTDKLLSCSYWGNCIPADSYVARLRACGWTVEQTIGYADLPLAIASMVGGVLVALPFAPDAVVFVCQQKAISVLDFPDACLCGPDTSEKLLNRLRRKLAPEQTHLINECFRFIEEMNQPPHSPRSRGRIAYGERPGEEQVALRIITLSKQGFSYGEIAKELNSDGIKTSTGKLWSRQQIKNVVLRYGK